MRTAWGLGIPVGLAAADAQPVLEYEAGDAVVSRVPPGLRTLADMADYLLDEVPLFNMAEYRLVAIAFDPRP